MGNSWLINEYSCSKKTITMADFNFDNLNFDDAISAAAAELNNEHNSAPKAERKTTTKRTTSSGAKQSAPKTDTPKNTGGASFVIPATFKQAIENYMLSRPDMVAKMAQKGKSNEGCCEYIFKVMLKRAEKMRNGKRVVSMYSKPEEIFGLAVHYYDETNEDLNKELSGKE